MYRLSAGFLGKNDEMKKPGEVFSVILRRNMKFALTVAVVIVLLTCGIIPQGVCATDKPFFVFATRQEGRDILTTRDEFVEQMSPFDRSCRMRTDRDVTVKESLDFVSNNVLALEKEDEERIRPIIAGVESKLKRFESFLPDRVYLVKTTGNEEGGAAYTRGGAIVIPRGMIPADPVTLYRLLSHELFHIISRKNPKLRDELYQTIGFRKCPPFEFPKMLKERKITNPDSPVTDHCISVKAGKKSLLVVPILYSNQEKYSKAHSEEFFDYLHGRLSAVGPVRSKQPADYYSEAELEGSARKVGKNTDYTIHPEVILADIFSYLFFGVSELESRKSKGRWITCFKGQAASDAALMRMA